MRDLSKTRGGDTLLTPPAVGWIVYREAPSKLVGPHGTFEIAVGVAERLGNDFRIGYGARAFGADSWSPMEEPMG